MSDPLALLSALDAVIAAGEGATPGEWVVANLTEIGRPPLFGIDGDFADGHPFMSIGEAHRHSLIPVREAVRNARYIAAAANLSRHAPAIKAMVEAFDDLLLAYVGPLRGLDDRLTDVIVKHMISVDDARERVAARTGATDER